MTKRIRRVKVNLRGRIRLLEAQLADTITKISGSMVFVYLHVLFFILFFVYRPFQIEVFNILLSLEAVFLATFIMVAQNRERELTEEREREEQEAQEDLVEIQEDVEGIEKDVDEIEKDVDSVQKDMEEIKNLILRIEERLANTTSTIFNSQNNPR